MLQSRIFPGQRGEFAAALQRHSKGHPLHLRYTLQAILDRQLPLNAHLLERIPEYRPEGIAGYYQSLWVALGRASRESLHLVTACGFALPPDGIVRSLEHAGFSRGEAESGVREVGHLLEVCGGGVRPFHASLVVHVRKQPEHGPRRAPLLQATLRWLKESAPEEFRWAHAWALEADLGQPRQLIDGLTRQWLVDAVAAVRPVRVVEALISRGLWHATSRGELDALVRIALLCNYSIDTFEGRDDLVSSLHPPLLASDDTGALPTRLGRDAEALHHMSLRWLARDAALRGDRALVRQVFEELRRRARSHRARGRDAPEGSRGIHESAVAVGSLNGALGVEGIFRIATRNRARGTASWVLAVAARELRLVGDGRGLREILQRLPAADFQLEETRPAVREAVLHALEAGWSLPAGVLSGDDAAVRIHAALKAEPVEVRPASLPRLPDPSDRVLGYTERMASQEECFRDAFLDMLANHLHGLTDAARAWAARTPEDTWLGGFLPHLDDVASRIASALRGAGTLTFRRFYEELERFPRPACHGTQNIDEYQLSGCAARAAVSLGFDLVAIARGAGLSVTVTTEDIASLRHSSYCSFSDWLGLYGEFGRPLLAPGVWRALLEKEVAELAAEISPLPEKAKRYSLLAQVAAVEAEHGDARRLVRASAECLVAHGDHKDMLLTDVLRSVHAVRESLDPADHESAAKLREWVIRLAPPLVFVNGYTDGDETSHLPGDLAETLGRIAPELLPAYHGWLAGREEFDDALKALGEYLRIADLLDPITRAVAGTAVERGTSHFLEERAGAGDAEATLVLDGIRAVYGPVPERGRRYQSSQDPVAQTRDHPAPPDPAEYPPNRLESYLAAVEELSSVRDDAIVRWARHWDAAGQPAQVLDALERAYSRGHHLPSHRVAYRIARSLGDGGAFRWLVRAHRERASWYWTAVSEHEVTPLWVEVRSNYPREWLTFLRETIRRYGSIETPAEPWRGTAFGPGGFERLVKYCLAFGERGRAFGVVESVVHYSLEYLTPLRFPPLPWIKAGRENPAEERNLGLLFDRLTWPSALVRERACSGLAALLRDPRVREGVGAKLGSWVSRQEAESVQALAILACVRAGHETSDGGDSNGPPLRLEGLRRSLLATLLSEKLPPAVEVSFDTRPAHSGDPPPDFTPSGFFTEHARHFLAPLFVVRARKAERLGTRDLIRQWAYEWQMLQGALGVPLSTAVLDHWFRSSPYQDPCQAADPAMSEVLRSAYLRALAWAAERRLMPPEGARFLAGETCPVDLELWKIRPARRPTWWPSIEPANGPLDAVPAKILRHVYELHAAAMGGNGPWDEGWIPTQASGRISAADAVYDLEFVAFLQARTGPTKPTTEELSRLLHGDFLFPKGGAAKEHELSFRGAIRPTDTKGAVAKLQDWMVLPICGNTWAPYPVHWQRWRLRRTVWLPLVHEEEQPARFTVDENELVVWSGTEVIGRWRDWTDGVEETLAQGLTPPAGAWLLVRRDRVLRLAEEGGMKLAWAVRITCFERKGSDEKYSEQQVEEIIGAGAIV